MRERNFDARSLSRGFNSKQVKSLLHKLQAAEAQAIGLVKLFDEERYLTIDALLARLRQQQIPKVDLALVVAFLSGYMSAETYESHFDTETFGQNSSLSDAKSETAKASLVALLTMIDEKNILKLPNRVRVSQRKQVKGATLPRRPKIVAKKA